MSTWLEDRRDEALRLGYKATDWTQQPGYPDYCDALSGWRVDLLVRDGVPIGAVYTNGPEFHVSVLPHWRKRWATRRILKTIIPEPRAITRIAEGHEHVGPLLERLGFTRARDGKYVREVSHGH